MLLVALTIIAWIPSLLGWGSLLPYGGDRALRIPITGLLGLGVLGTLAVWLNFAVPLGSLVSAAAWFAGAVLFVARRRWILEAASWREGAALACGTALFVALLQPPVYDAGLYYLQAVRWAAERRVEIGLANLHTRLAIGSLLFPASALLELPYARGSSTWFFMAFPALFTAGLSLHGFRALLSGERRVSSAFLACSLLPLGGAAPWLGSHGTDATVALLTFATLGLLARALEDDSGLPEDLRAAALLGGLAAAVKSSGLPLLLVPGLVALARRRRLDGRWAWRTALPLAAMIVPCLARSLLLSGCMVLPLASTCVPSLPWAIPRVEISELAGWITAWARRPGVPPPLVLAGWDWIAAWGPRVWSFADVRLTSALALVGLAILVWRGRRIPAAVAVPYGVALLAAAAWFLGAPDPRFAFGYLYALGAIPLGALLASLPVEARRGWRVAAAGAIVTLALAYVRATGSFERAEAFREYVPAASWPALPVPPTSRQITAGGYAVLIPRRGDQCWAAPLPCTPYYDERLVRTWALLRLPSAAPRTPWMHP